MNPRRAPKRIFLAHTAHEISGFLKPFLGTLFRAFSSVTNLVNEAAIIATRRKAGAVGFTDFTEAIERIVAGLEKKSRVLSKEERRRVAYHEMGHALVASGLPPGLRANEPSITRGLLVRLVAMVMDELAPIREAAALA